MGCLPADAAAAKARFDGEPNATVLSVLAEGLGGHPYCDAASLLAVESILDDSPPPVAQSVLRRIASSNSARVTPAVTVSF